MRRGSGPAPQNRTIKARFGRQSRNKPLYNNTLLPHSKPPSQTYTRFGYYTTTSSYSEATRELYYSVKPSSRSTCPQFTPVLRHHRVEMRILLPRSGCYAPDPAQPVREPEYESGTSWHLMVDLRWISPPLLAATRSPRCPRDHSRPAG